MEVKKSDGSYEQYSADKVKSGVYAAYNKTKQEYNEETGDTIVSKLNLHDDISTEEIRAQVEEILMDINKKVAKAYIKYGENEAFIKDREKYMEEYANSTDDNAASLSETDPNSNQSQRSVASLEGEVFKTKNRNIQRKRMKDKLKVLYPEVADTYKADLEDSIIYAHDEASTPALKYYCQAVSLYPLMSGGVGNIDGVTPSAPNDLQSFGGQVTNLDFLLSAQCKGAVALGEYQIALILYIRKEYGTDWLEHVDEQVNKIGLKKKTIRTEIKKCVKQFIYGINQPASNRNNNSPFTNISIYDHTYYDALFKDFYYPDGTQCTWEEVDYVQRLILELRRELNLIKPLTFPVTTIAMVNDGKDIIDKEYKLLCAEEWSKGSSHFCYNSNNPSSLASCCFDGKTRLMYSLPGSNTFEKCAEFGEVYNKLGESVIEVFGYNPYTGVSDWVKGKLFKTTSSKLYRISFKDRPDWTTITATHDHLFPVERDGRYLDVMASELVIGDKLLADEAQWNISETDFRNIITVPIDSLEEINELTDVYCVELEDQDSPYFVLANGIDVHNCRVLNEITENTFSSINGLQGIMTGSCNVITINLNRITQKFIREKHPELLNESGTVSDHLLTENEKSEYREYLTTILERVYKYHIAYKTMLYDMEDKKMFASSNGGYIYMKKLYSTVGLIGYQEAAIFLGLDISKNQDYIDFLQLILSTVKEQNKIHSIHDKKYPFLFNSEAIPGENLAVKFYQKDKKDGYFVPRDRNLFASYFFNPWDDKISVLDKMYLHGKCTSAFADGGQACHINLMEDLSVEQYLKMIDYSTKEGTNYWTINRPISVCADCGCVVDGPADVCPKCGSKEMDWWTRIIGYLRPLSSFSKERFKEAKKRIYSGKDCINPKE